jgi:hypothetical protein
MPASISNISLYEQLAYGSFAESVAQNIENITAGTRGGIQMSNKSVTGAFDYESFIKITASIYNRNPASTSTVTSSKATEGDRIGVKVGTGSHFEIPAGILQAGDKSVEAWFAEAGRQYANVRTQYELNQAINAAVSCAKNNASVVNNVISAGVGLDVPSYGTLNGTLAKAGDRSGEIVSFVMRGVDKHRITGQAINNSSYQANSLGLATDELPILNRSVLVTDASGLYLDTSTDEAYVLALKAGAIVIEEQADTMVTSDSAGGSTVSANIKRFMQWNGSFMLKLMGYQWDVSNGGYFPSEAILATGANWLQVVTSHKDTGIYLLRARDVGATA